MSRLKYVKQSIRRPVAYLGLFGTTQLHLRNPLVIACWSMAFPGMGAFIIIKIFKRIFFVYMGSRHKL